MPVVERDGRNIYEPAERQVLRMAAGRTITETDLVTFANLFLTPSLQGKQHEAHAVQLITIIDGLASGTYAPPEYNALLNEVRRSLVGDMPITGGGSLGWSNWKLYKPVRPGDTISIEIELERARATKSRPGMVIYDIKKTAYNQHGEKVIEVVHQLGSW
jgi:3-hydroxymyristoyl/3-hydroxydecanoyl-(acyl carrier protein) dehydratase